MSQPSPVYLYSDSEKALRSIAFHCAVYQESLTLQSEGSSDSPGSGETERGTLQRIQEVLDNAKTTQVIPNKSTRS